MLLIQSAWRAAPDAGAARRAARPRGTPCRPPHSLGSAPARATRAARGPRRTPAPSHQSLNAPSRRPPSPPPPSRRRPCGVRPRRRGGQREHNAEPLTHGTPHKPAGTGAHQPRRACSTLAQGLLPTPRPRGARRRPLMRAHLPGARRTALLRHKPRSPHPSHPHPAYCWEPPVNGRTPAHVWGEWREAGPAEWRWARAAAATGRARLPARTTARRRHAGTPCRRAPPRAPAFARGQWRLPNPPRAIQHLASTGPLPADRGGPSHMPGHQAQ
jgi:hypothetical protein